MQLNGQVIDDYIDSLLSMLRGLVDCISEEPIESLKAQLTVSGLEQQELMSSCQYGFHRLSIS